MRPNFIRGWRKIAHEPRLSEFLSEFILSPGGIDRRSIETHKCLTTKSVNIRSLKHETAALIAEIFAEETGDFSPLRTPSWDFLIQIKENVGKTAIMSIVNFSARNKSSLLGIAASPAMVVVRVGVLFRR